jgi:HK97 family phage major capsid protein
MTAAEFEKRKIELNAKYDLAGTNEELDALDIEVRKLERLAPKQEKTLTNEELAIANGVQYRGSIDDNLLKANGSVSRTNNNDDMEYRKAFRDFVVAGKAIPKELRANANTLTTDVKTAIPETLLNRIIETMESIGMILPLVTRTSYPNGVNIAVMEVKPVASWVKEGATSDKQKTKTKKITFTANKLRCEIQMSLEVSVQSIEAFENAFIKSVATAMTKALEDAIINGTGEEQPTGILAVGALNGQKITYTNLDYKTILNMEASLPQAYENNARYAMSKKMFYNEILAITDDNGQPIARVNAGINGRPERVILGRTVELIGDYLDPAKDVKAFIFNFEDYLLNTIYDLGIASREDWDTENKQVKSVMSVDGKMIDNNSLVTLSKTTK